MKKFDFVVGNPPYQLEPEQGSTRKPPVYHLFMDDSYKISKSALLITPARFLFNSGFTPNDWNRRMLNDEHFKVLKYEEISKRIFPSQEIKGGIAISYYSHFNTFKPIEIFMKFKPLEDILNKVTSSSNLYLESIISSPLTYSLSELMQEENPDSIHRLRTSAFKKIKNIFFNFVPNDGHEYIGIYGLENNRRVKKYVRRDYISGGLDIIDNYNVLLSKAVGDGLFGEKLSEEIIAKPGEAYLQTYISIGAFNNILEAINAGKYIKTKFARALLGILKVTQDCPGPKWEYVPLQDFTENSDIDWSKSIAEIDQQLYKKYGLSPEEIDFIEEKVQEME